MLNRFSIKQQLSTTLTSIVLFSSFAYGQGEWTRPDRLPEIPTTAPRTWILANQQAAFSEYCTTGEGTDFYTRIKEGFDEKYLSFPFPDEPKSFGDSDPKARTSAKIDAWRKAQDTCNEVAGIASTATIIWRVNGEQTYLDKAREFLVKLCDWDPEGTTGIEYNDETNFRLLRLAPEVYDQIRDELTAEEKAKVLAMFQRRGTTSFDHILRKRTGLLKRNSLEVEPSSHPVRFMPMLGMMGLALWDDLPEAKDWFAFAYGFYENQFSPWGGDDGGWAEGIAYWRGVIEHASFQDALLLIDAPEAYAQPFWKNTFYFPVYFLTPWRSTAFGDTPVAGAIGIEPGIRDIITHAARVHQDGYLRAYADLYEDPHALPEDELEFRLWRKYPTPVEYLLRDFLVADRPLPAANPLSDLPQSIYLKSIGWAAIHTDLGNPQNDIFLQIKSSPYGSFSHSHADQNAFILNAFGEGLAINSGYREFHRSPHHNGHTRQTLSKNAVLIGGEGQTAQDATAIGQITRFVSNERATWVQGDATQAYQANPKLKDVELAQRDVIMLQSGLVIIRDEIRSLRPESVQWLIHSNQQPDKTDDGELAISQNDANLLVDLVAVDNELVIEVSDVFAVPVDPKYLRKGYDPQFHLIAATETPTCNTVIYAVLQPSQGKDPAKARIQSASSQQVEIIQTNGQTLKIDFSKESPEISQT
ncbi:heparinase II/III domain-containing protein [Cerasicoccus arenae]|uniref:Oligo alginate lyase n=2 Tax=Cerasicoccus arenae TaxID=424488 RepID=A0A8J3DB40_9BACT|nr:heparinase II/III family protein [Cerasicoccus arenae]MBK1857957.1 heparinase II/III family protein [Cerasicoccus arenae]GHB97824.1 oligo alginate lyase [Cerasicoccus arenae]